MRKTCDLIILHYRLYRSFYKSPEVASAILKTATRFGPFPFGGGLYSWCIQTFHLNTTKTKIEIRRRPLGSTVSRSEAFRTVHFDFTVGVAILGSYELKIDVRRPFSATCDGFHHIIWAELVNLSLSYDSLLHQSLIDMTVSYQKDRSILGIYVKLRQLLNVLLSVLNYVQMFLDD